MKDLESDKAGWPNPLPNKTFFKIGDISGAEFSKRHKFKIFARYNSGEWVGRSWRNETIAREREYRELNRIIINHSEVADPVGKRASKLFLWYGPDNRRAYGIRALTIAAVIYAANEWYPRIDPRKTEMFEKSEDILTTLPETFDACPGRIAGSYDILVEHFGDPLE